MNKKEDNIKFKILLIGPSGTKSTLFRSREDLASLEVRP